jgi:hypothetical protein
LRASFYLSQNGRVTHAHAKAPTTVPTAVHQRYDR